MIKKILVPILIIAGLYVCLLLLNNINRQKLEKQIIEDITPPKFVDYITSYEEVLGNPSTLTENLKQNIYRCYEFGPSTYGFIVGTMGYEEEMLVYVELEYLKNDLIKVKQVDILYENETDGYGDYVVDSWFLDRFKQEISGDIRLVKRKKTSDNQVIAITGASITSEAIINAVNDCKQIMEDRKNENE